MTDLELVSGSHLALDAVGPGSFRVRVDADGMTPLERYRIVRLPRADADVSETSSGVTLRSGSAALTARRSDGALQLDTGSPSANEIAVSTSGGHLEIPLAPDEKLYGMGDASRDTIQRRGQRLDTWVRNVASYAPVPFVMSSAGWGLFVNSTRRQVFDLGATEPDVLRVTSADCTADFVLFSGPTLADVLAAYTAIAGRPTLLPRSAYGFTYVCNQQADARAMLDEASRMREHDIPCDIIGLEPGWMETRYDYSTDKRWHPERFYVPEWMMGDWHNRNWGDGKAHTFFGALERLKFKLSLWLCCDYDLSHEAERRALAAEDSGALDNGAASTPADDDFEQDQRLQSPVYMDNVTKVDEPWFEHLKKFVDQGAAAFKLDGANQVMDHPDRAWGNGMRDDEMHNLYPVLLSQQMHEGFVEHTGRRPLIYSSCGYTGTPQFAATWAGDTGGGPRPLVSMLNHGMTGHSNTSCDMDVFTPAGIHFGFLQAWSQVCSWAYWRQPWLLGKELEAVFRDYAKLRYRLLPYIYSTAWHASQTGMPILRAMPLAFPDDSAAASSPHQYMFGDAFLVGAFTNEIHLPAGDWIDYWSGQRRRGPVDLTVDLPADRGGPLFVRVGAIVPTWPEVDHAQSAPDAIGIDVYPGADGEFTLYEDDGETVQHRRGAHSTTRISQSESAGGLVVSVGAREGGYDSMPRARGYDVRVHTDRPCRALTVNGAPRPLVEQSATAASFRLDGDPSSAQRAVLTFD